MKLTTTQSLLLALIAWFSIKKKACTAAFVPSQYYSSHPTIVKRQYTSLIRFAAPDETTGDDSSNNQYDDDSKRVPNDLGLDIVRGSPSEISDDMWDDIEGGAPSRWMVMKDVGVAIENSLLTFFVPQLLSSIINLKLINCKHLYSC